MILVQTQKLTLWTCSKIQNMYSKLYSWYWLCQWESHDTTWSPSSLISPVNKNRCRDWRNIEYILSMSLSACFNCCQMLRTILDIVYTRNRDFANALFLLPLTEQTQQSCRQLCGLCWRCASWRGSYTENQSCHSVHRNTVTTATATWVRWRP